MQEIRVSGFSKDYDLSGEYLINDIRRISNNNYRLVIEDIGSIQCTSANNLYFAAEGNQINIHTAFRMFRNQHIMEHYKKKAKFLSASEFHFFDMWTCRVNRKGYDWCRNNDITYKYIYDDDDVAIGVMLDSEESIIRYRMAFQ